MNINLELFNPNQLVTELTSTVQEKAWQKSQNAATAQSLWQTYLNQLTLDVLLPLFKEEQDESVRLWLNNQTLGNISELVNGTAIVVGDAKIILIPSEAEDLEELRIPQEWIDIPEWSGNYYLGVQVNIEANFVRVWGYTTHQKIKTTANYDHRDRSYSLDGNDLIADLNALWVARELCPDEITQAEIAAIPELLENQADNLIQRLGKKENLLPRLSIPFEIWSGLMQNAAWRNNLVEKRRGITRVSVLQWFQVGYSDFIAELGWRQIEFQPNLSGARGVSANLDAPVAIAKRLTIAEQPYELKIVSVEPDTWRFELRSLALGSVIPQGLTLRLLTATRESFVGNEAIANKPVEMLGLEVALDAGESLIWEIEPTPDDYQAEILKF
ncbi:Protein of unknown function (DUF1822) [Xenococcus sp. PCC 7305]|uniref:DUF1822 family protein n=1 Tax=Xenococcus sp. PCC 7305 TaxID=102125 RepID=UPI0002AC1C84|nr:DUF1822 family protein [Xenococcus sp. PCC 7305]ELS04890.1 Protein of unknown function (DUF1822) [Xenococcus sp. PCC 7305]